MNAVTIFIGSIILLELILIGSILTILSNALKATGRNTKPVLLIGIIFLIWLTSITFLNFTSGIFTQGLFIGIGIPVLIGVLLLLCKPYREVIKAIPQKSYMKLQALRILFGSLFLIEIFFGVLPDWFRNLAGWGDIAAGVAGLIAFILIARLGVKKSQVIAANMVGILDFLIVLPLGLFIVVADAPIGLSINLIPLFAVPLFILQHIYSLTYLKK